MCDSTVVKELPETSIWHGAISEEDVQLVRRRHAEKVEEWLDFADFVTELNALHEKYGIEKGEEGYFAYRKHLRTNYYQKLETYGPTPDPLDEGCDCIFCKMHAEDEPAESATGKIREKSQAVDQGEESSADPEACRFRCADQPAEKLHHEDGPHSGPYTTSEHDGEGLSKKLGPVPTYEKNAECGRVLYVDHAVQEGHPATVEYQRPSSIQKNQRRLGQVPAELPIDAAFNRERETCSQKLGPVPAYKKMGGVKGPMESAVNDWGESKHHIVETKACWVRCADGINEKLWQQDGPHSGPYATTENDHRVRQKKLGRVPAYFEEAVVDTC